MTGNMKALLLSVALCSVPALEAAAACNTSAQAAKDPEQVVEQMVENAEEAPGGTGEEYVGGEPAKPVENWFGCKPGNTKCIEDAQAAQAKNSTDEAEERSPSSQDTDDSTASPDAGDEHAELTQEARTAECETSDAKS